MIITKQKQLMSPMSPESPNSLMQEGKQFFLVGQVGLPAGTAIKSGQESLGAALMLGQLCESHPATEEARVLSHPDVVTAFDEAADAIDAWEKSL